MSTVFIYALNDPETNLARYIGKSWNPKIRLYAHLEDKRMTHRTNWIKSLKLRGLKPVVEILEEVPIETWSESERYYIRIFREMGFDLVNMTDGGDGQSKGYKPRPESIAKIVKKAIGRKRSAETCMRIRLSKLGKKRAPFSDECRRKMSEAHSGPKHFMFGKHHTESSRAKISAAHTGPKHHLFGKHLTEECKRKIGLANSGNRNGQHGNTGIKNPFFGKKHSPETRLVLSQKQKAYQASKRSLP